MKKLFFILIMLSAFAPKVFAASIDMIAPSTVKVGDTVILNVVADTEGESINSVNIVLNFDPNLLTFTGYKKDGTIINLWVETPHEADGKVYMSGIIPGGVSGLYDAEKNGLAPIPVSQLLFNAKSGGKADFSFAKSDLLKNDGKGTELAHGEKNTSVIIEAGSDSRTAGNAIDHTPPEPFDITYIESSIFSRTPSMIIFKTDDTDSGVQGYKFKIGNSAWRDTSNPQPINKNIFPRAITVRAYDYAGNFQEAHMTVPGLIPYSYLWVFVILLMSGILGYKLLKYRS